jgi:hypothetical protein
MSFDLFWVHTVQVVGMPQTAAIQITFHKSALPLRFFDTGLLLSASHAPGF